MIYHDGCQLLGGGVTCQQVTYLHGWGPSPSTPKKEAVICQQVCHNKSATWRATKWPVCSPLEPTRFSPIDEITFNISSCNIHSCMHACCTCIMDDAAPFSPCCAWSGMFWPSGEHHHGERQLLRLSAAYE